MKFALRNHKANFKYILIMKAKTLFGHALMSICALVIATSCGNEAIAGNTKTIEIPVTKDYRELSVSSAIDVTWSESASAVELTADENVINKVKVERIGPKLSIYVKGMNMNSKSGSIKVILPSSSMIDDIEISGASIFVSDTPVNASKLDVDLSGASRFQADLNVAGKLDIECSGASELYSTVTAGKLSVDLSGASMAALSGNAGLTEIELSGASALKAASSPVVTTDTECELTGASAARINCKGHIKGTASGASSIRFGSEVLSARISCTGASSAKAN